MDTKDTTPSTGLQVAGNAVNPSSSNMYLKTTKSFADIQVTKEGIVTKDFLEASQGIVGIFALLNSTALNIVKNDLQNNIDRLSKRYESSKDTSKTLEIIVKDEATKAAGKSKKEAKKLMDATEALLWLTRGLEFTCAGLKNTRKNKDKKMSESFGTAYDATLKPHHPFLARPAIYAALAMCPTRDVLYQKLAGSTGEVSATESTEVDTELDKWMDALDVIVKKIQAFFTSGKYDANFN